MDIFREILKIILENTDEGIHVIDSSGKTILYNNTMGELEGLVGSEVIGKRILEIFPSLTENTSTLCKVLNDGDAIIEKYQTYVNKKGYKITSVNTTIPIKENGKILGAVEISKNFTRIKELYDGIIQIMENSKGIENKGDVCSFGAIIGCSPKFLKAVETAKRAADSMSTVLIYGETGTGKEVFARAIHNEGKRSRGPFIGVNCAALPEGLLEGILFGTVRGGFTGAVDRPGLFEQANGGTLLLDEINSMSIQLQAKLLRVLQEGYVRRIGDVKDIKVAGRIIATTNEEPTEAIINGRLRKDLYYRLSVINIKIPPLRERREDIQLFTKKFIDYYNNKFLKDVCDISRDVYDGFMSYDWPGNVRELKNYIEGAMNMVEGHILRREDFTEQVQETLFNNKDEIYKLHGNHNFSGNLDKYLYEIEKQLILDTMKRCSNNISKAARELGIKRQTLQHKLRKYGISVS